jgi:hypothetical protein
MKNKTEEESETTEKIEIIKPDTAKKPRVSKANVVKPESAEQPIETIPKTKIEETIIEVSEIDIDHIPHEIKK